MTVSQDVFLCLVVVARIGVALGGLEVESFFCHVCCCGLVVVVVVFALFPSSLLPPFVVYVWLLVGGVVLFSVLLVRLCLVSLEDAALSRKVRLW